MKSLFDVCRNDRCLFGWIVSGIPRRPLPGAYSNWRCSSRTWYSRGWSCDPVLTSKG